MQTRKKTTNLLAGKSLAVVLAGVVSVSGCSLINPHISIPPPTMLSVPVATSDGEQLAFAGDLPLYIDYANEMREAYYDAVGNQSLLRNGTALTLIPLAATALYLGITGEAGTNTLAALGVGGVAGYGISSYLESKPQQQVFLAGANAVGCAVLSVTPWLVTDAEFKIFKEQLQGLPTATETVARNTALLRTLIASSAARGLPAGRLPLAQTRVNEAQARIAEARDMATQGAKLRGEIETAHLLLYNHLMRIRHKVSVELTKVEPKLSDIMEVIGGLSSSSLAFTPTPSAAPVGGEPADAGRGRGGVARAGLPSVLEQLNKLEQALDKSLIELATVMAPISNLVHRVDEARTQVQEIQACVPEGMQFAIQVRPRTPIFFPVGENGSWPLTIKFGTPKFTAAVVPTGTAEKGLIVEQPGGGNSRGLAINAVKPDRGNYTLIITDNNDETLTVPITVGPRPEGQSDHPGAPPAGNGNGGAKPGPQIGVLNPLTPTESRLTVSEGIMIQKTLCLEDLDADFGRKTREAIRLYQAAKDIPKDKRDGKITRGDLASLINAAPCDGLPGNYENAYERFEYPNSGDIKALQSRINQHLTTLPSASSITASGVFDTETRDAIKRIQKERKEEETGQLAPDLDDDIGT